MVIYTMQYRKSLNCLVYNLTITVKSKSIFINLFVKYAILNGKRYVFHLKQHILEID